MVKYSILLLHYYLKYVFHNSRYLHFIFILKLNHCTMALIYISASNRIRHTYYKKKEKMKF